MKSILPEPLIPVAQAAGRAARAGAGDSPDARTRAVAPPRTARPLLAMLERLAHGSLALTLPDGRTLHFGRGEPRAAMRLSNWAPFAATLARGDVGFAQAWIAGDWDSDDLYAVLDLAVANRDVLERAVYGRPWGRALARLRHLLHRNTRAGSRRNIHAHYDLGNAFYRLWLDPGKTRRIASSQTSSRAPRPSPRRSISRAPVVAIAAPSSARAYRSSSANGVRCQRDASMPPGPAQSRAS